MYILIFLILSAIIFVLLLQINIILGAIFFILAIITLPAAVLQRREAPYEKPVDAESHRFGLIRLVRIVGLDTTGIAIAMLLLILIALIAKSLAHL